MQATDPLSHPCQSVCAPFLAPPWPRDNQTKPPKGSSLHVLLGAHHRAVCELAKRDTIVKALPIVQHCGLVDDSGLQHIPQLPLLGLAIWFPSVIVHLTFEILGFVVVQLATLLLLLQNLCVCRLDSIAPTCHTKKSTEASTSLGDLSSSDPRPARYPRAYCWSGRLSLGSHPSG